MSRSALRRLAPALVLSLALLGLGTQAGAEEDAKPMVVKIHADWCGTCQRLESTFEALAPKLEGEATIVVLDVTDRDAVARSAAEADRLGIRAFFDRYKGRTGTVGILDAGGNPVAVLKGEMDPDRYVAAVRKAKEA